MLKANNNATAPEDLTTDTGDKQPIPEFFVETQEFLLQSKDLRERMCKKYNLESFDKNFS